MSGLVYTAEKQFGQDGHHFTLLYSSLVVVPYWIKGKENKMTYYESAKGLTITKARAYVEFKKHHAESDWVEFILWAGDKETYCAEDVLGWLGY